MTTIKDRVEALQASIKTEEEIIGKSRDRLWELQDELTGIIESVERGLDALSEARTDLSEAVDALSEYV